MNKWSAYIIRHAYQLCIIALFQLVSHFNFTDGDEEKRLVGLRQPVPLAKIILFYSRVTNIPIFYILRFLIKSETYELGMQNVSKYMHFVHIDLLS